MRVSREAAGKQDDWRDLFYLYTFLSVSLSDRPLERREQVWIRRFLANRGKASLHGRMQQVIDAGGCDPTELQRLGERAARELSMGEKRHFIYNLAQLCKSKGPLDAAEYASVLDIAEGIGVSEIDADSIIHSVYSVNDTFIAAVGLLAIGAILYFTQAVIVPLVVAVFITTIVQKVDSLIASSLSVRRFRWLTKLGAMVIILGLLFGLVMAAVVSGTDIANRLPDYAAAFNATLRGSPAFQDALVWLRAHGVLAQLQSLPIGAMVASFLGSLIRLLGNFVLVVIFSGFLVSSASSFTGIAQEMTATIGTYMTIHTLMCLLTGVVAYVLCRIFGIDFALFWALAAFLLNYIPTIGSILATVPLMLLAIVQLHSWTAIVLFIVLLWAAQVLIGQVLEPKLMGTRLGLRPVAILLGLIFWGVLWGIPGTFLATPLMVLIRILSSYFNVSRGFERLLASERT